MAEPIRIGYIDLSFHQASALEVGRILQTFGHEVIYNAAPHEAAFERLGRGESDIFASAWLPSSHDVYLAPMLDEVDKLSVIYEPYCIWGVPDYVPEEAVSGVEDLLKAPALSRMERLIQGINPGAGISRFSAQMIKAYGLDSAGYYFEPGTESDCFGRYEQAVAAKKWVVIPLWHPQFLHNRYAIRTLKEPKGLLGVQDEATLLVRKAARKKINPAALAALSSLYIGNARLSALEDELRKSAA
ncbi:glycine betaine ABC transporter substrate-binding protein [Franconibacter pulveris]|uniref:glycine betaine ABC transporter substrate-binding protein n=1 Tax=Franconibacter pulveris TaxID=435910 RepID=UPI0005633D7B|nr:glycine betaine ABC transporter substrate-binding protein [Franconibacter pulveris]